MNIQVNIAGFMFHGQVPDRKALAWVLNNGSCVVHVDDVVVWSDGFQPLDDERSWRAERRADRTMVGAEEGRWSIERGFHMSEEVAEARSAARAARYAALQAAMQIESVK